jgi:hypothetical protein
MDALKRFFGLATLLLALFLVAPANAQSVQQSGTVTRNHLPYWVASGVIGDAGSSADSPVTSMGVTNNGGAGFCVNSDRVTAAGRNQLCFGAATSGPAFISLQNLGTAPAETLNFIINGVTTTPASIPGGATPGDITSFGFGNALQDTGLAAAGGVITSGAWNGTAIPVAFGGTGATTATTARTNLGLGSMATQNSNAVAITGGTITGLPTPVNPSDAAIKSYVDATATGLIILAQTRLATAAVLPNTPTYNNGAGTLTAGSNTTLTVDGTVANLNDVVLVKNQASAFQNGIYTVTAAGSGAAPWVLTRASYFNSPSNIKVGSYTFVTAGATNINTSWVLQASVVTLGTDPITFNLFSSAANVVSSIGGSNGIIALGSGLSINSNVLNTSFDVDANVLNSQTGNYTIQTTDCGKTVQAGTGSSGFNTITLPSVAGFDPACTINVVNGDTGRGKNLSGFPNVLNTILWPLQTVTMKIVNGAWYPTVFPHRWRLTSTLNMYVRPDGSDTNDGLANSASGAFLTANAAFNVISENIDINLQTVNVNHTCSAPPCSITAIAQLLKMVNVHFVGGMPSYLGDCTTPTNVKLNPSSSVQADIQSTFSDQISVCGFEMAGGANVAFGTYVSGGGTRMAFNGPMQCDTMSGGNSNNVPAGDCFFANSDGNIYLQTSSIVWAGNVGAVFATANGGLIENATGLTLTASGNPACGSACAFAVFNGKLNFPSLTNSGTSTGPRFQVGWGGEINTATNLCTVSQTYFPGNSNGVIFDVAGNRGNCF